MGNKAIRSKGKRMKCEHDDCYTCPYKDCISDVEVEPERKKRGRKKLPPEEKARRRSIQNHLYYLKKADSRHEAYMEKTEGKVKRRYRAKSRKMASYSSEK